MDGIGELARMLGKKPDEKQLSATAIVTRTGDDGTVYVEVPGGAGEFPVNRSTVDVSQGDTVTVEIANGRATITGSTSAPSISAARAAELMVPIADAAQQAASGAAVAQEMAQQATDAAASAVESAATAYDKAVEVNTLAQQASEDAAAASTAATAAQDSLKSVVQGATTVEKAVSVMQTALESVIDYDPNTTTETFTGDGSETDFALQAEATDVLTVTVGGEAAEYASATVGGVTVITFAEAPASGAAISVTYEHATVQEWFWHDANGAHVLGDTSGYRNDLNSTGMDIRQVSNEVSVAQFGANGARIGPPSGDSRVYVEHDGITMTDADNSNFFIARELRSNTINGAIAALYAIFKGDGTKKSFTLPINPIQQGQGGFYVDAKVNGTTVDISSLSDKTVTLVNAPADGSTVKIEYNTKSVEAKSYTVGIRSTQQLYEGPMSYAEGSGCASTGYASHAEGSGTTAGGKASHSEGQMTTASSEAGHAEGSGSIASGSSAHAEGSSTTASGYFGSHAEGSGTTASGYSSHAEGHNTTASGAYSHAEGHNTTASGNPSHAEGDSSAASAAWSHAQNLGTLASSAYQTSLGKYNVEDANNTYAAIIGNGTADNARSNALAVRWNGLVDVAGANTAYPLFIWSSTPTSSSTLPISPCFIYCTGDNGLYYCV